MDNESDTSESAAGIRTLSGSLTEKRWTAFLSSGPRARTPCDQSSRSCSNTHVQATRLWFIAWTDWPLNVDDLRRLVQTLTAQGIGVEFRKENLAFTGNDSSMSHLMLTVLGAVAQFERDLIRERQREGIALAKAKGVYRGRKKALSHVRAAELVGRAVPGQCKASLAREFGISRETLYQYLRQGKTTTSEEE